MIYLGHFSFESHDSALPERPANWHGYFSCIAEAESVDATEEPLPKPKWLNWLNIEQLMQILPLKKSRIYYLTHIGGIPHHKIGQTLLFREDEILEWMQSNKVA